MKNLIILLLITASVFSQEIKFGKVSGQEVKEKFHPIDSTASAAYLYKSRNTVYEYNSTDGFVVVTKVHERIKIYNKQGMEYANKLVSYYKPEVGKDERVGGIKGYTFNLENGELVKEKLSNKQVFDEKKSKFWSYKKIAMPAVKVGSVIDLKYEVRSPYHTSIEDVELQFGIPVKQYITTIEIPEYYIFRKNTKGFFYVLPKESSSAGRINFTQKYRGTTGRPNTEYTTTTVDYRKIKDSYIAKNIPALKDNEPYVSSVKNYRGGVSYELSTIQYPNSLPENFSNNWKNVSSKIYKSDSFGGELGKTSYFKNDLAPILANATNEFEKTFAVFQFVKQKVKWNKYYGYFTDKGVKKAYKERTGNVADINLMLTAMLREAGLNAEPVLVSSKNHGIPLFPSRKGFNYVISSVEFDNGSYVLLDATEPLSMPNVLPSRVLNWKGRKVMKDGTSSWVRLNSKEHAIKDTKLRVKITPDNTIEGFQKRNYTKEEALNYRLKNNKLAEEDVIANLEEAYGVEIENYRVSNATKLNKPVSVTIKFTSEDFIETINDKLYINPLFYLAVKENPFKSEERKFPVDFINLKKDKKLVTITIPEGYKPTFLPESIAIGLPDGLGVFKFAIKVKGKVINLQSVLQFDESVITPEYYTQLKDFFQQIVDKNLEKIILEKE